MFKKTIHFKAFDGTDRIQDFYFHMSKAELLTLAADGSAMMDRLNRMVVTKDAKAILSELRSIVEMACGVRSDDGARFLKTDEAKSMLLDSPAYDELLVELCTNAHSASEFVNQLLPKKMLDEVAQQLEGQDARIQPAAAPLDDTRPLWMKEGRVPTQQELIMMSPAELQKAFEPRGASHQ
jgi:hypothetical protein